MQALILKRDRIEYAKTRALLQGIVNKEAADGALKEYLHAQMPYLARAQKDERQQHIKRLVDEVARGPMRVTPVMTKQVKSRLKSRVVQRSAEEQSALAKNVSKRIGGYV